MSTATGRQTLIWLVCLAGALQYIWIETKWVGNRGTDYNQFRAAAELAGSGRLYDYTAIAAIERTNHERTVPFGRLPFFALLFKPVALLPYSVGRVVWWIVNLSAIVGFALLWPHKPQGRVMALFWSCPVWMLLNYGQDTGLFLFFACLSLLLLARGRDVAAGLVLSLCASKFHLALGFPVFLLAARRWRVMASGAAGCTVMLAISFTVEGPGWLSQFVELSKHPEFSAASWRMPNLAGLVHSLPFALGVEVALSGVVLGAVWFIGRTAKIELGVLAALTGGLLVSHRSQAYDCVLLLPALFFVLARSEHKRLALFAVVMLLPIPYLFLLVEPLSLIGRLMLTAFPILLLGILAMEQVRAPLQRKT